MTDSSRTREHLEPPRQYKRCAGCGIVARVDADQATCTFTVGPYGPVDRRGKVCGGALTAEPGCHAVIFHGPGHQSTTRCTRNHTLDPVLVSERAPEPVHCAIVVNTQMRWHGTEAFTGFSDEAPDA